jgi:Ca2+-binding EF-hand superfamily protein
MKKTIKTTLNIALSVALSTLYVSSNGIAQDKQAMQTQVAQQIALMQQQMLKVLDKLDINKDGKFSAEELKANDPKNPQAKTKFNQMDLNKDGFITKEELKAMQDKAIKESASKKRESFADWDKNKDGKLSVAEVQEKKPQLVNYFDKIDTNKDKFLVEKELEAFIVQQMNMLQKTLQQVK